MPPDVGIELMGPDSDYRCGGKKGFKSCYGSSSTYSEAEINKPMDSVYVPAGISSDKLEGLAGASYQSKPFLKMEGYHMNVVPP